MNEITKEIERRIIQAVSDLGKLHLALVVTDDFRVEDRKELKYRIDAIQENIIKMGLEYNTWMERKM